MTRGRRGGTDLLREPERPHRRRPFLAGVLAAVLAVVALGACAASVPDRLNLPYGDAGQLVVVTARSWSSTSGLLTTYERVDGGWQIVHQALPVRLGRNGFNADHREGDGTTPAGSF
ncbi:MAG: hypothetical protein ABWZ76_04545, partial [Acidimicrobiales bacterium]